MTIYKIVNYRSGSRCVVLAQETETAGSEVVFGPASWESCDAWKSNREAIAAGPRGITADDDTAGTPDHNRRVGPRRDYSQGERRKNAERRIRQDDQSRYMNQAWPTTTEGK